MDKCIYCNNILNDNDIRLIKNNIYTDIINVRKNFKIFDEKNTKENYYEPLLNNVQIDDKYVHIKNVKGKVSIINTCITNIEIVIKIIMKKL